MNPTLDELKIVLSHKMEDVAWITLLGFVRNVGHTGHTERGGESVCEPLINFFLF